MIIRLKYRSQCTNCGIVIFPSQLANYYKETGHVYCYKSPRCQKQRETVRQGIMIGKRELKEDIIYAI